VNYVSFANAILFAGAGLIAVPILLHLLMRQQPKRIVFPAVRFIKQRQQANRRRLRFRHLVLLAARCLAILLLVLAVARPSIPPELVDRFVASSIVGGLTVVALLGVAAAYWLQSRRWVFVATLVVAGILVAAGAALAVSWIGERQESNVAGGVEAPVAAALVFDTSPRLAYRHDDRERLDVAREMALWLVGQLPSESEIAVLNSRSDSSAFAIDRGAAQKKIESLGPTAAGLPLPAVVAEAIARVRESELEQREVYVFTDLAAVAWPGEDTRQLAARIKEGEDVRLYLIDVGVEEPLNFTLGDLRRFDDAVPTGGTLALHTDVSAIGAGGERTVELHEFLQDNANAIPEKPNERPTRVRARKTVNVTAGGASQVELSASGFAEGTTQGFVQLVGGDGLSWDDRRYFTVTVAPAKHVLIASPKPVDNYVLFMAEAVSPSGEASGRQYTCDVMDLDELTATRLEDLETYAAVCVLDPTPATAKLWTLLADYARLGGGVGVFLGANAGGNVRVPVSQINEAASDLLPAPLQRIRTRTNPPFQLVTDNKSDAILARLANYDVPWSAYPVYKYWQLGDLSRGVRVVARFSDGGPAILDAPLGQGRVVWMTTPVSDPASILGYWNLLPTADPPWPFLALIDGTMNYLTGGGSERFNYTTGESAVLSVPPRYGSVVVTTPPGDNLTLSPDAKQQRLFFRGTEWPGCYVASAGGTLDRWQRGFSANAPAAECNLTRIDPAALREAIGLSTLEIAKSREEINRDISRGRVGVKLFPWIALVLAGIMAAEFVLATFFYRTTPAERELTAASKRAA
jgi:hypothetical protein